tara:strand:- start:1333 stop:1758 length:426 start_codon:yes stop_codon:yes gene_type:complete
MAYIGNEPVSGAFDLLDDLTASATAAYTLTKGSSAYYPATAQNLIVSVNGVTQEPVTAYTVSGNTLTFTETLSSSDTIDYILALGSVRDINVPADGTVVTASLAADAVTHSKINLTGIPTSDPGVAGAIWSDSGALKVSSG